MWAIHFASLAVIVNLHLAFAAPVDSIQQFVLGEHGIARSNIISALKRNDVIPDVLDVDFKPLFSINVTYPERGKAVDLGNEISPKSVSAAPFVVFRALRDGSPTTPTPTTEHQVTYTLVLTDPDATSRSDPTMAEMCHWIITGMTLDKDSVDHELRIPLSTEILTETSLSAGSELQRTRRNSSVNELMSYYPPAPPSKTGHHRYVFVLLASDPTANDVQLESEPKKPKERPHWGYGKLGKGVRDWAKDNGLTPVGANFFYAKNKKQ